MDRPLTELEFDCLSWHDNLIYGLRFEIGEPERQDWRSELVLDIDYVVEWPCGAGAAAQFRVAPATLTFRDVTNLSAAFDFGDGEWQVAPRPLSIDRIGRRLLDPARQKVCLDRPYWRWLIALNDPSGGEIAFGASGFSQALRAEPLLTGQPFLPRDARS
ncbi:MAG: hypothetical protein ACREDZ_03840 [Kiloniellales bacterium]